MKNLNWQQALIEATEALTNVILVAHSTGGMFALATPELEKNLIGLVLMDSAPDTRWQTHFMQYVLTHPITSIESLQKRYEIKPSNALLKEITIASLPYFSTSESIHRLKIRLNALNFNNRSHRWSEAHFDGSYQYQWVPQQIPTLIFAGALDNITPLGLFSELKIFQRDNIHIQEISQASHFPWMENPTEVAAVFSEYCQSLASSTSMRSI